MAWISVHEDIIGGKLRELSKSLGCSQNESIAVQLQNKALEALQRVKVEDMSPRDIREYIKLATDLERLNRSSAATDNELEAEETTSVDIYMPEKEEDSHE